MTARMQAFLAFAGGVGASVAIAACGGDSSPEQAISTPTETQQALSKADFIEEADRRCEEVNSAIGKLVEQGEGFTGAGEIADLRQDVLDQLTTLGPPAEDRRSLDQFLSAMEKQVEAGEKIALAIQRDEDTTGFEEDLASAQEDAAAAAKDYGFKECGSEITATDTSGGTDTGAVPVTPAPSAPVTPAPSTGGGTDPGGTDGGDTGGGGGGVGVP